MTQYRVTAGALGAPHSIQAAIGGRNPGDEFEGDLPEAIVQSGAVEVVGESEEEPSESGTEAEPEPGSGDAGEQQPGGDGTVSAGDEGPVEPEPGTVEPEPGAEPSPEPEPGPDPWPEPAPGPEPETGQ